MNTSPIFNSVFFAVDFAIVWGRRRLSDPDSGLSLLSLPSPLCLLIHLSGLHAPSNLSFSISRNRASKHVKLTEKPGTFSKKPDNLEEKLLESPGDDCAEFLQRAGRIS